MPRQPNVVFILADQHNAKFLGCKDHPDVQTPHLDALAAGGVRFDNAVTQNPICTPSRVSWLSGQYCHNHGYYGLQGPTPNGLPSVIGHFRRAGYATAAIGKIHCPDYWVEDVCDVFHETCDSSVGGRSKAYADFLDQRGKTDLEDNIHMRDFGRDGHQSVEGRPSPLTFEESQEGWIASQGVEFMRQAAAKDRPFFLHASFPRPHECTAPSQEFWDLYQTDQLTLPPSADGDVSAKSPDFLKAVAHWRSAGWTLIEPKTFEAGRLRKLHGYLAAVSQVDHAVGQLLAFLAESGLDDNTIVVYSADHGEFACEHDMMEKAPGIGSDAVTRIPMIWRWAGKFAAGHVAEEIVEAVDLANTLCGLADLEAMPTADGKDISPLLQGAAGEVRSIGVTENPWSRSIRKGKYRLVWYPREMYADQHPGGFGELYDLEADPWEMTNLYFQPDYLELIHETQAEYLDWLITSTRPVTVMADADHTPLHLSIHRGLTRVQHDGKVSADVIRRHGWTSYI